jgi:hypothetical protein
MSTDARLQERPIGKTVLPLLRRIPESPAFSISHVPACSRRYAARSKHAWDCHRAGYSGSCLNVRLWSPRIAPEKARKLTQPFLDPPIDLCLGAGEDEAGMRIQPVYGRPTGGDRFGTPLRPAPQLDRIEGALPIICSMWPSLSQRRR